MAFPGCENFSGPSRNGRLVYNHSYENEFNLPVNEISFSHERTDTENHFENYKQRVLNIPEVKRTNILLSVHHSFILYMVVGKQK